MSPGDAAVVLSSLVKAYGAASPLRLRYLAAASTDRVTLLGCDRPAAETIVHLITGAAVPDEGSVCIAGHDTREIATDTEWLSSLDRFGIVTERAIFLESLPVAANLAIPITLAIDPMSAGTRAEVERLADLAGLARATLDERTMALSPLDRARLHLARAFATKPEMLLLEQPTGAISDPAARAEFGRTLASAAQATSTGWIALTDDADFAAAAGGRLLRFNQVTGELSGDRAWPRLGALFGRIATRK
jgi:ABC-type lipoprotein export system ATPase subunit